MSAGTLGWVAETLGISGGRLVRFGLAGQEDRTWHGGTVDTRWDCRDRLFFAFDGEVTDGHRFAAEAINGGAAAVVVEKEAAAKEAEAAARPFFLVDNTLSALQDLARAHRRELTLKVVAVTGSSGKSTTKEFTRRVLARRYRVYASPSSFNSRIGVPLTILDTSRDDQYLVAEVGANRLGEIAELSELLKPDLGIITNIGRAHIGLFGSQENIVQAKSELLDRLPENGWAVLPGDDDFLAELRSHVRGAARTFGFSAGCDYRISAERDTGDGWKFDLNGRLVTMKTTGRHNLLNAAAALAAGELCEVAIELGLQELAEVTPLSGRGQVTRAGGLTVIDDAYNANPDSMRASLSAMLSLAGKRRLAVLGDMNELGEYSSAAHQELGEFMAVQAIDVIVWFGGSGKEVAAGYRRAGGSGRLEVVPVDAAAETVTTLVRPGDIIMVKGSRACGLERIVAALLKLARSKEVN